MLGKLADFITEKAHQYRRSLVWALGILVSMIVLLFFSTGAFERLELLSLDYRFILRPTVAQSSEIVFIDIAQDSIEVIGRWPWPRKWHAALIKILSEHKPRAIVFDVIFSEPQDLFNDAALVQAMSQAKDVYLPILYNLKYEDVRYLYKGAGIDSVTESIPVFSKAQKGSGHINVIPDIDGIIRRVPAIIKYKDSSTYQLGMKAGFDLLGIDNKNISFDPKNNYILAGSAQRPALKVPLDANNQMLVNWRGRWGKVFKHYSFIDVIKSYAAIEEGERPVLDLEEFKDKICLVGLTAPALIDIRPVPIQKAYPAVGINAMVLNSVLTGNFITEVPKAYNIAIILFISIFTSIYLSRLRLFAGVISAFIVMGSYALFSLALFVFMNIAVSTFYPIFAVFLSYSMTSFYAQTLQSIERARLFKQATRDGLTSLYNIRHFNLLLEAEFKNVATYKSRRLSIVMADVDNFKKLNDTYGHQAGDAVLKEAAKVIQSSCRQTDVAARYGGEEFIVMLSGASHKEACDLAEKMRASLEAKVFRFKNTPFNITISIGVVEYSSEKTKDELVAKADSALYRAKQEGKNRVCVYSSDM